MLTKHFYQASKKISSKIFKGTHTYSNVDLEGFKKSQKLAYTCAFTIAKELKEGWTEKQEEAWTKKLEDKIARRITGRQMKNLFFILAQRLKKSKQKPLLKLRMSK